MNKSVRFSAAFTIVEMLVSISIFTVITSLVLTNYPKFSEHFALERTAQEVAQSLREAKTLSLAVTESALGAQIFPGYGVHFEQNSKNYLIFSDIYPAVPNKIFDASDIFTTKDRTDSSYGIQADAIITGFCAGNDCVLNPALQVMDIVFTRPEPVITFWYKDVVGYYELSDQNISIFITNAKGESKKVVMWKTGQVSVK
ncbi:MAG: type II secretion system protein [Patescibacteria group bacterium]